MNTCPQPPIQRTAFPPALMLAGFAILAAAAQAVVHGLLPMPRCLLLQFTGIPCPTCGCTRSLAAWTQLDLASALLFNPLFFVACVGAIAWSALRLVELRTGRSWIARHLRQFNRTAVWVIGATAVVLNWLYLCLTLPR